MQERLEDSITYPEVLKSQLGLHSSLQKNIEYCRFSESPLWSAQRQYFQAQGINPWRTETVPFYATSNPSLARSYARIVVEYWLDGIAVGDIDINKVLPIVEMGCGSGTFTFYFLQSLRDELSLSSIGVVKWKLFCTDISMTNGQFVASHPRLQSFVEDGHLVAGCFDVETQSSIFLSDDHIISHFDNPCVAIANYLFDSLTQDLFHLHYGRLYEAQVGLSFSSNSTSDDLESDTSVLKKKQFEANNPFDNMKVDYRWKEIDKACWLSTESQKQVETYLSDYDSNVLLYPSGAIQCISHLREMTNNRLMLLCSDKGFYTDQDTRLQDVPTPKVQGSFSLPVNFNALERYCDDHGGLSWSSKHREEGLVYLALIFGEQTKYYGNTQKAIYQNFDGSSPDHLISIARGLHDNTLHGGRGSNLPLEEMLSYLKLFNYCPKVFDVFLSCLLKKSYSMTFKSRNLWGECLNKIWNNTYFLGGDTQCLFDYGALALDIKEWGLAVKIYRELLRYSESEPAAHYNLALSYTHLGQWSLALGCVEKSISLMSINGMASDEEENLLLSSVQLKEYCQSRLYSVEKAFGGESRGYIQDSSLTLEETTQSTMLNCFLAPLDNHFAADILHQCRDRNIASLTRLPDFETLAQVNQWIEGQEQFEDKHIYCVIHKEKGFVGLTGVHQEGDAGYFFFCVGTDYQNQGIGHIVLDLLIQQSIGLGVVILFSGVYRDNYRSLAVLKKHDFSRVNARAKAPDSELDFYCLDLLSTQSEEVRSRSLGADLLDTDAQFERLEFLLERIRSPIKLINA